MSDPRRKAAEEYAERIGSGVSRSGNVVLAHLAGQEHTIDKLRAAVNEECSCGGCGPDDPQACQACMVWHRVTGGEG